MQIKEQRGSVVLRLLALGAAGFMLSACGQKGPLTLPATPAAAPATATPPASAPAR